jgi:hypothetical protein
MGRTYRHNHVASSDHLINRLSGFKSKECRPVRGINAAIFWEPQNVLTDSGECSGDGRAHFAGVKQAKFHGTDYTTTYLGKMLFSMLTQMIGLRHTRYLWKLSESKNRWR